MYLIVGLTILIIKNSPNTVPSKQADMMWYQGNSGKSAFVSWYIAHQINVYATANTPHFKLMPYVTICLLVTLFLLLKILSYIIDIVARFVNFYVGYQHFFLIAPLQTKN